MAVDPRTRARYASEVKHFLQWAYDDSSVPLTSLDRDSVDSLVSGYLHHLYASGIPLYRGVATVYGLINADSRLHDHMRMSKLALRGWRRLTPSRSYPPLTWDSACVIALKLVEFNEIRAAIAVLVMFDCYLRIGEATSIRYCDVIDASSARMGSVYRGTSIVLPRTKTGHNQSVVVRHPVVIQLLNHYILKDGIPAYGDKLFGLSAAKFRRLFKKATAALGLSSDYVPHSLRRWWRNS